MKRLKEELREKDQGGIGFQRGGPSLRARVQVSDRKREASNSSKFLNFGFKVFEIKLSELS